MRLSLLSLLTIAMLSWPASAAADLSLTERSDQTGSGLSVELHTALPVSPVGMVGLMVEWRPAPYLGMALGVGGGCLLFCDSGVQGAGALRFLPVQWRNHRGRLMAGVSAGLSGGRYVQQKLLSDSVYVWDRAYRASAEVDLEAEFRFGGFARVYFGYSDILNGQRYRHECGEGGTCTDEDRMDPGPRDTGSLYLGTAFGYRF